MKKCEEAYSISVNGNTVDKSSKWGKGNEDKSYLIIDGAEIYIGFEGLPRDTTC